MNRLYAYIVASDTGYAPNTSNGVCTLAYCKPKIRGKAQKGDYVLGLGKKKCGNRVVYAMRVTETLKHDCYLRDERFEDRWGDYDNLNAKKEIDKSCRVLISDDFVYWGGEGPPVPDNLKFQGRPLPLAFEPVARSHRVNFWDEEVKAFIDWFHGQKKGCLGISTAMLKANATGTGKQGRKC